MWNENISDAFLQGFKLAQSAERVLYGYKESWKILR